MASSWCARIQCLSINGYGNVEAKDVVSQHESKVYGKAAIGAPPMSVPHLDARKIGGSKVLLFGPFAGFSPR